MADDENIICSIEGRRKRGGAPCTIEVGYLDDTAEHQVVLRTEDVGGVPPIVALLTPEDARALGMAFITAAARVD